MSWNIRQNPFFPGRVERHDGIDLPYGMNEMINAKQDGVIKRISNDPNGYGNFVDILHDDGTTGRYAHAGIISRGEGQRVKRGDEIGLAGSTGRSTGPHLHFEHHDQSGRPMDPRPLLASVGGRAPTQFATGPQAAPTQNLGGPNMDTVLPQATGAFNPRDPQSVYDFINANQQRVQPQQLSPEQQQMLLGDRQQRASMLPLAMGAALSGDRGMSGMGKVMYADSMAAQGPQRLGDQGWLTADGQLIDNPYTAASRQEARGDRALNLALQTVRSQQGGNPYYSVIKTAGGDLAFDARSGKVTPILGEDGKPVISAQSDPQLARDMASGKAGGTKIGASQADDQITAPKLISSAEYTVRLVDDLLNHPGMKTAVGKSRMLGIHHIPGTDAKDFEIRLAQLQGRQFLEAFESLKGAGQITEIEGIKATQAIARMNAAGSEKDFIEAAREFQDIISASVKRLKAIPPLKVEGSATTPPPAAAPENLSYEELMKIYGGGK
jgi:hypothetical protein